MQGRMYSLVVRRLLWVLIPSLTGAKLLSATFGLDGQTWYAQSTAIVPAVAGAILAILPGQRSALGTLTMTFLLAWSACALLSGLALRLLL
jgi:hypothetical protein